MLSVVVLARGQASATRRCLAALRRHTPAPVEVLLVDNASGPSDAAALRALARSWPAVRLRRNRANVPFAAAVNAAMLRARGELLCWLNNDAVVGPGWYGALSRALAANPLAAAAGPRTGAMAPPEQLRPGRGVRATGFLGGFCLLLRREALARVGLLDERFVWGWEDMDYCLRLRQAGYRLLLVPGARVAHEGGRTMRTLPARARRGSDRENRRLFLEKWVERGARREEALALLAASPAPDSDPRPDLSVVFLPGPGAVACARHLARAARGLRVERLASAAEDARAERVLYLHPAARPAPGALKALLTAAREGLWTAVAPRSTLTLLPWQARPGPAGERPYFRGGCLLVERAALVRVGGLDARLLPLDAEADLCLRLRQAGGRLFLAPHARVLGRAPQARTDPVGRASGRLMFEKWGAGPFAAGAR